MWTFLLGLSILLSDMLKKRGLWFRDYFRDICGRQKFQNFCLLSFDWECFFVGLWSVGWVGRQTHCKWVCSLFYILPPIYPPFSILKKSGLYIWCSGSLGIFYRVLFGKVKWDIFVMLYWVEWVLWCFMDAPLFWCIMVLVKLIFLVGGWWWVVGAWAERMEWAEHIKG